MYQNKNDLLRENVDAEGPSGAGDGLGHSSHASLHVTPCSFLLLQLSHHMMQEHIPSRHGHEITAFQRNLFHKCSCSLATLNASHPLPGLLGLVIAPMTASVASVALNGSDSNHRLRIWHTHTQGESDEVQLMKVNCC